MPSIATRSLRPLFAVPLLAASGCGAIRIVEEIAADAGVGAVSGPLPRTAAERSGFTATSTHGEVIAFIDSLQRAGLPVRAGSMGRSAQGRDIPYMIVSRPLVSTPAEARRLGRLVVYVQGNIHAGEVEGKEALLAVVRDLAAGTGRNALDSLVLIAVPIYNTDGNEQLGPQERNRSEQNGPERVGQRANGQGLDLNRDYVKAEAPETRASLALLTAWDADVFVDLHTTDGSYHGYALTYSPSLHPAAGFGASYARDSLLPELRRRMRARHQLETFDYGNFSAAYGNESPVDTVKKGWWTYDHRGRYGTNHFGLRGRVAVLSEAYSHDPFERRVRTTEKFLRELLSLTAARAAGIRSGIAAHDDALARGEPREVALRSEFTRQPRIGEVISEDVVSTGDSTRTEPGLPRGLRRTGRMRVQRIPVHDRFDPTLTRRLPPAYAIPPDVGKTLFERLRTQGIIVQRIDEAWSGDLETFETSSVDRAARPFQGHNEVRVDGRWSRRRQTLPAGTWIVQTTQPFGVLAATLLEPESDDSFASWNALDGSLAAGAEHPVRRVMVPIRAPMRIVE